MVQLRIETYRPAKDCIQVYEWGPISRDRVVCSPWGDRKIPDNAFVCCSTVSLNFIYPPVVGRARNKTIRIIESRKANDKKSRGLVAPEARRVGGAVVHIVKIIAEVHIVRGRSGTR